MLTKLRQLVHDKNLIDQGQEWYNGSITYFEGLKDETIEVEEEMKDNNSVYLEDELGDILWDYLNLIEGLKNEGKITSLEKVLQRAEKKYSERINAIKNEANDTKKASNWSEIKKKQKQELLEEHNRLYNN